MLLLSPTLSCILLSTCHMTRFSSPSVAYSPSAVSMLLKLDLGIAPSYTTRLIWHIYIQTCIRIVLNRRGDARARDSYSAYHKRVNRRNTRRPYGALPQPGNNTNRACVSPHRQRDRFGQGFRFRGFLQERGCRRRSVHVHEPNFLVRNLLNSYNWARNSMYIKWSSIAARTCPAHV